MIVGGDGTSTGVEVWNPDAGTVDLLADKHPLETGSAGLSKTQLVPVNGNNLVLAVGGCKVDLVINKQKTF